MSLNVSPIKQKGFFFQSAILVFWRVHPFFWQRWHDSPFQRISGVEAEHETGPSGPPLKLNWWISTFVQQLSKEEKPKNTPWINFNIAGIYQERCWVFQLCRPKLVWFHQGGKHVDMIYRTFIPWIRHGRWLNLHSVLKYDKFPNTIPP